MDFNDFDSFVSPAILGNFFTKGKYEIPEHINIIDNYLIDKIYNKKQIKLIVNLPPRHGKSELISFYFPIWYLSHFPNHKIILTTYESSFAQFWARRIRNFIKENRYTLHINIKEDVASVSYFELSNYQGSLSATGTGGAITGKGADLIIIDDPVKNDEEANSPTMRQNLSEWYKSTLFTRLEPTGHLILLMTRWHENDLAGELLQDSDFDRFIFPAITNNKSLWTKRYNLKSLNDIKNKIGNYWFNCLYQQSPIPPTGNIINSKKFRLCNHDYFNVYKEVATFQTIDLGLKTGDKHDFTCILTYCLNLAGEIIIKNITRLKLEPDYILEYIISNYNFYKPSVIGIESVSNSVLLIKLLKNRGLPIQELYPAGNNKITRSIPIMMLINSGKVFILGNNNDLWVNDFFNECNYFPNSQHDDQIDCLSYITDLPFSESNSASSKRFYVPQLTKGY